MIGYNVLLALTNNAALNAWIGLAQGMLNGEGEIYVRGTVTMPQERSLSEGALPARAWREGLRQMAQAHPLVDDEVHVYVDYQPLLRVLEDARELPADLLLLEWEAPGASVGGISVNDLLAESPCDVVLISGEGWDKAGDVLLSLRGGPNLSLGVRVAQALAGEGAITLFHAADQRRRAPDLDLMMRSVPQIARTVTAVTGIADGIVREAAGHKAIIMGATFRRPEAASPEGQPIIEEVFERTGKPVILVRGMLQEALEFHPPNVLSLPDEPISTRVDRWFAENTFHSDEFSDLNALLGLKLRQNVRVSVALPALNEEETVGNVIRTLKQALMEDVPLVDEIVLIDSDSTDRTVAIAEVEGIPVYNHQDILADVAGSNIGKGEALWKSLYATTGDIIAWVDTDITNIHPRFIYGLIGPLLKYPRVQYVKGFYARPIKVDGKLQAYGGGRVTELVARPLFNLFYPALSGIVQPLSGEYAGRRSALEQVPFFSGYGVETGLLIDLLEKCGLNAIAQSDLEIRVHHNQPLANLSKMAFAILQVFIARIENRFSVQLLDKANRSMKMVIQEPERFALDIAEIMDIERPPMITFDAYREKFQVEA